MSPGSPHLFLGLRESNDVHITDPGKLLHILVGERAIIMNPQSQRRTALSMEPRHSIAMSTWA